MRALLWPVILSCVVLVVPTSARYPAPLPPRKNVEYHLDGTVMGLSVSHSGKALISCDFGGKLVRWDLVAGTSKTLIHSDRGPHDLNMLFGPDSTTFFIGSGGTLKPVLRIDSVSG